jgi:large subunit ribosomal protein L49
MLARDLANSLFEQNSPEASRMKIDVIRSKNLEITGGRWKNNVVAWLQEKGF